LTMTLICAPTIILHDPANCDCLQGDLVQVERYVAEVRHRQNLGLDVPVQVGLCSCAQHVSDNEMQRLLQAAARAVAPAHALRQSAVADGGTLVDERKALELLGCGHTTFWKLIKEGRLPPPMKLGRKNLWLVEELRRRYAVTLRAA